MTAAKRTIEVDEATAAALEARATRRGLSISELLAEIADAERVRIVPSNDELDDLDRQWQAIQAGEPTIPHEKVARWLDTWGTPSFRPWTSR